MKKIISLILIVITALTLFSCSREEGEAPYGMKVASSELSEYYLYVPKDWEVTTEEDSLMASARASESDPSNVTMIGFEDGSDEYETIDDFWAYCKNEYSTRIFDFADGTTTFTLTNEGEATTVGGLAAKKYEYRGKIADSDFCYTTVLIKRDSIFYIFTYTSTPSLYDKHLEDVGFMLSYVEFK
ncbi:MAG: hypothetical protein E7626_04690 [Ruminococcaceae bacterium]|nr:hypothetical protein [Oscillospiraceae bacterium]